MEWVNRWCLSNEFLISREIASQRKHSTRQTSTRSYDSWQSWKLRLERGAAKQWKEKKSFYQ
ncbi:hypothetical protein Q31a_49870 [Aureliella helgolandensis]|uniref:Uncharacterized protein n=1 Tax=Aureliella helgolandensis TaxID=2527968 RepID=A0A518GDE9_9BACT|nr:hypothetical protein Q31a_49870 [Aureliella helgolandensis]